MDELKDNDKFGKFLSSFKFSSLLNKRTDLMNLMFLPIQRLAKYELLLGALLESPEVETSVREELKKAKSQMTNIVTNVNKFKRKADLQQKVLQLRYQFKKYDGFNHTSKLIAQGSVKCKFSSDLFSREANLFVFQEFILIGLNKRNTQYDLQAFIGLQYCDIKKEIINLLFSLKEIL